MQECSLVTGWRTGRTGNAALVDANATAPGIDDQRQGMQRLQRLWRAWMRNPERVELLRELHEPLGERLGLVRG